ncbi:hypothetical protein JW933_03980 [candidate division FCPU426 bacterium]|nr:hypothetical protein [candidate division FCPU426 bacterium]
MIPFRKICVITICSVLVAGIAQAQEALPNYGERNNDDSSYGKETYTELQLRDLREMHEGAIFLLKRYATLEALITAVQRQEKDNDAFWIGAASLLPGTGQMINEDYLQGGLLLFAAGMSWSSVGQLEFTRKRVSGKQGLLPYYYAAVVLRNGIMTYAMLHAANKKYRKQEDRTAAMWTGAASLVPGVGQAINGDWWEAGGLFAAWSAATVLTYTLEEEIFLQGDEGYLVLEDKQPEWWFAYLPGGIGFFITTEW